MVNYMNAKYLVITVVETIIKVVVIAAVIVTVATYGVAALI